MCKVNGTWRVSHWLTILVLGTLLLVAIGATTARAEIRVLAAGDNLTGPYTTEQIFANGDLVGSVDRPSWDVYRNLTTADIAKNYDVLLIPYNTSNLLFDFSWQTRMRILLALGKGVIWEAPMTTGSDAPLFTLQGVRYVCPDGTICYIPDSALGPVVPLTVLPVSGLTDGITGDTTVVTGYFPTWDPALSPFLQVDATGLGTINYGLYGQVGPGRIVVTQNYQDLNGSKTGTAIQVNEYNLMLNKLVWTSSSTLPPDPRVRFIPHLVGETETDAVSVLNELSLVNDVFLTTSNEDLPGNVVGMNPQPGAGEFTGESVDLIVVAPATGAPVVVPDIKNLTEADAISVLNSVGLEQGTITFGPSPTVPAGSIISQNRVAGSTSNVGWIIDMVESIGSVTDTVPSVQYLPQTDAESAIGAAGLVVGNITLADNNVIPAGYVISTDPGGGVSLAAGGSVNLVVSAGVDGVPLISVPDEVGQTQSAAEASITSAGLVVGVENKISSDTVPLGSVISQNPVSAAQVAEGTPVDLVISSGPATTVSVTVPNVVGDTQATAESALVAVGLVVGTVTTASSTTVPAGSVISQSPVAGTSVTLGSAVDLVVSSGVPLIAVPNVVGLTQTSASSAITSTGLVVGSVTQVCSRTVAAGIVISESPTAGTLVAAGSAVDLEVSRGFPRRICR
jgi:beta-lactam-binding protein with PASTA domain